MKTKQETRIFQDVPLAILRVDSSVVYEATPSQIRVVLSGPARQLRKLEGDNLDVYVDTDNLPNQKTHTVAVVVDVPEGLIVEQVTPPSVTLVRKEVVKPQPTPDGGMAVSDGGAIAPDAGVE